MLTHIKNRLKRTFVYDLVMLKRSGRLYYRSMKAGHLRPPSYEVKRLTILLYGQLFNIGTFIETGTYLGETIEAVKGSFWRIYSIELQPEFCKNAKERFACYEHIKVLSGNSAEVLPAILTDVREPCIFWLDGHYSHGNTARGDKNTPIREELRHILGNSNIDHVLLIDDARCFTGGEDYPTLGQIKRLVTSYKADYDVEIKHDIIRVHKQIR